MKKEFVLKGIVVLVISTLFSCQQKPMKIEFVVKDMDLELSIDNIDASYIQFVQDIKIHNNHIYVLDIGNTSLYILNKDFQLINKIGSKGGGPGEYAIMHAFFVNEKDNALFVADRIKNRIMVYDNKSFDFNFIIDLPDNTKLGLADFFVLGNTIYYASPLNEEFMLTKFDFEKQELSSSIPKPEGIRLDHTSLIRPVGADYFLAVCSYSDKIYHIDLKNENINEITYTLPDNTLPEWHNMRNNKQKDPPLFLDSYFSENALYLAYQNFNSGTNGIIKVVNKNGKNEWSTTANYHFPEKNGDYCFAVDQSFILTFAVKPQALQKYNY
jgi:hypothetical protein